MRLRMMHAILMSSLAASAGPAAPGYWPAFDGRLLDFQEFGPERRVEDFNSITSQIEESYAMLEYKQRRFGFDWNSLKADYLKKISDEFVGQQEFQELVQEFVSKLGDAHTGPILFRDAMLNGFTLSTLGFKTGRAIHDGRPVAKVVKVYEQLFRDRAENALPIRQGDLILRLDGRAVETVVNEDLIRVRNLGQSESSLTAGFAALSIRPNLFYGRLPSGDARLELIRDGKEITVVLPWIKTEPEALVAGEEKKEASLSRKIVKVDENGSFVTEQRLGSKAKWPFGVHGQVPRQLQTQLFYNEEARLNQLLGTEVDSDSPAEASDIEIEGLKFKLISSAKGLLAVYRIEDFFWSRLTCQSVYKEDGFEVSRCDALTGEKYAKAFHRLQSLGVKGLVLDLRSNGGGILHFGYELARAFVAGSVPSHLATLRLTEEWMSQFRFLSQSEYIPVSRRAGYKSVYETLQLDASRGQAYSTPVSITGSNYLSGVDKPWAGPTFLLVDEMCASMCDIFATHMQDLKVAKVIGKQTMGAGGNVIPGNVTPHSKIFLTLTASMMHRLDGSTIENEGATPDYQVESTVGSDFWKEVTRYVENNI